MIQKPFLLLMYTGFQVTVATPIQMTPSIIQTPNDLGSTITPDLPISPSFQVHEASPNTASTSKFDDFESNPSPLGRRRTNSLSIIHHNTMAKRRLSVHNNNGFSAQSPHLQRRAKNKQPNANAATATPTTVNTPNNTSVTAAQGNMLMVYETNDGQVYVVNA